MVNRLLAIIALTYLILGIYACANQVALTGGPRDESPPMLDTVLSFANNQTRVVKQPIELYFDEFVDLRDPSKQIVVSPPLKYALDAKARLKKVTLKFDDVEVLKEDVTYIINFGEAIQDFNESNKLQNFRIVFSTGDFIDSLSIKGKVMEAFTGNPLENVLVMLYDLLEDSIVFNERPFYFARTDREGLFEIGNIRADTFKVFALVDENLNYLYDLPTEKIGFIDSSIILHDSADLFLEMSIFQEVSEPRYLSYDVVHQGKLKIEFNNEGAADSLYVVDEVSQYLEDDPESKVKFLWYAPRDLRGFKFMAHRKDGLDTINARINLRTTDTLRNNLKVLKTNQEPRIGIKDSDSLVISFDRPFKAVDSERIFLLKTTQSTISPSISDTTDVAAALDTVTLTLTDTVLFDIITEELPNLYLTIKSDWQAGDMLDLVLLEGAVIDIFGKPNDSIAQKVEIATVESYGNLKIDIIFEDEDVQYVFEFLKQNKVIKRLTVDTTMKTLNLYSIIPDQYELRIIKDINRNGKWDTGNYLEKRQPESLVMTPLEKLKAGWGTEIEINLDELFNPKKQSDDTEDGSIDEDLREENGRQ